MRLQPHHVELLSPLEKQVYSSLIGKTSPQITKRQVFMSQSQRYIEGDEDLLPFPERSKRGIMLRTLSEQLAKENVTAAFMKPLVPEFAVHIKNKLLALNTERVYAVPPKQAAAAIHGNGTSPFGFYRDKLEPDLPGLVPSSPLIADQNILCAINPPPKLIADTAEYNILAILLKTSKGVGNLSELPLFAEAAHLGLIQVDDLGDDRLWLSKEETD